MPDQNQTSKTNPPVSKSDPITPLAKTPSPTPEKPENPVKKSGPTKLPPLSAIEEQIISKIDEFHNILIALSSDPSVDEIAAAIGLTLHLDRMGKRATAIYSGHTPNALEFLNPDETFETSADALQDFVIALNKEKADHLRYKLDGEYVKIYITPYKARIAEEDLDFSYGDYNVDLVLAIGVANGIDLDDALREHGRIMHDASIVNITTGNPGKFGEIEWSNKAASSVSEMIATLLYNMDSDVKIDSDEATAFLTGIVAATDRFSKANTSAITMEIASRLMDSGAKHQLISKNITADLDNKLYSSPVKKPTAPSSEGSADIDSMAVSHIDGEESAPTDEADVQSDTVKDTAEPSLLDELKDAENDLTIASAETTPDAKVEPVSLDKIDETPAPAPTPATEPTSPLTPPPAPTLPPVLNPSVLPASPEETPEPISADANSGITATGEKTITPPSDFASDNLDTDTTNKYGKMLEDALSEGNPAASIAPPVASAPEINGVPEINYSPVANTSPTDGQVLPPPPAPPIDMNSPLPEPPATTSPLPTPPTPPVSPLPPVPPTPTPEPSMPAPSAPVTPPPAPAPAPNPAPAPDAFKIPGM
ncbi:hypothetical protein IKE19_00615 [Candidatus Saccharibacteria bacterium]|nr:hypothetical protein [Candidatus Saccharibacteria bacterium]